MRCVRPVEGVCCCGRRQTWAAKAPSRRPRVVDGFDAGSTVFYAEWTASRSRPQPKVAMVLIIRGMERKAGEHCKWKTYAFQSKPSRMRLPRSWACGACIMLKWCLWTLLANVLINDWTGNSSYPPMTPNFMFSLPHRTSQPLEPKSVRWLRSHFIGAGSSSSAGGGRGSLGFPATPSLHHTAKVGMGFRVG